VYLKSGVIMEFHDVDEKIAQLIGLIAARMPEKNVSDLSHFVTEYYRNVPPEDIAPLAVDDIYGAALSHWNFGQQRKLNEIKIRVFNPTIDKHGWQSSHTIVEIIAGDMPFLVQSVIMAVNRHHSTNHLVIHPVYWILRSRNGALSKLNTNSKNQNYSREAFIHVEVDRQSDLEFLQALTQDLTRVLNDVKAATEDWEKCREKVRKASEQLQKCSHGISQQDITEAVMFLNWLLDDHFVFLGFREHLLVSDKEKKGFRGVANSGLGVLRDALAEHKRLELMPLSDDAFNVVCESTPLLVTKATTQSTVHRPVFMDYVGVRQFDKTGKVIGEMRFIGLFDSSAYSSSLEDIPILKRKILQVFKRSGHAPNSHGGRSLMHVLEDMPRDELYHSDDETLYRYSIAVLQLQERQKVRVFVRQDVYGQFISVLVFVPRERFDTDLRKQIQAILIATFDGKSSEFKIQLSESVLARIHFIIHTGHCCSFEYDITAIEQKIVASLYEWSDGFKDTLHSYFGEERGNLLYNRYRQGISAAYREDFSPRVAALDIERIDELGAKGLQLRLYQTLEQQGKVLRFKLYNSGNPAPLSKTLPMLENMGVTVVDERPYEIKCHQTGEHVWIHDFGLIYDGQKAVEVDALKSKFEETFEQIWFGRIENDGFNKLVLVAKLDWRQLTVLRAVYFYLRQIRMNFSQAYVEHTLSNNPGIAILLVRYFEARFCPHSKVNDAGLETLVEQLESGIDQVESLDEDRILRRYLNIIQAILRTNYYQFKQDNTAIPYVSFKLDPAIIQALPPPRPSYEIFVYSPRVEGVHLRGGKVARGGLRWSDRREDFRTEILGLMKAQVTKNSVIVPTGAKGGFVAKMLTSSGNEEGMRQEVINCYRIFIQGLLDITDNLSGGNPVKPADTICYDNDDPYLVVAADKGTATFSDLANQIAGEYGFWLGDAFASGGSVGYDHKKMGVTARGAWESVKHHFGELGVDIQKTPITVVGIGDMSGDVFGNGMLRSGNIRLLAAFNHRHIFLDPDPDTKRSFEERKRLFALPRSSWSDYDKQLLSKGGGIYSRNAKSIRLTAEIKKALLIEVDQLTPNELIRALLCAPVDLFWNGGIGTYVKASTESDSSVGDRSNDAVRVDGRDLRCRVVGEGGNLGLTQLGRLEYCAKGGRVNTDSIDNSAGVDCSDHEVNIKILLNQIVENGDLTIKQRNKLLERMTDEVADLVLKNNYLQNKAISAIQSHSEGGLDAFKRVIDLLEQTGWLDRQLEFIPNTDVLDERKTEGKGLLRPEIAVLLAYCKIMLKDSLLEQTAIFNSEYSLKELIRYFPVALQDTFSVQIRDHRLMREIIANQLVNSVINRMGITFPYRLMEEAGADVSDVMRTYCATCEIFGVESLWTAIEALGGRIELSIQKQLLGAVIKLVERSMFWLQRNAIVGSSTSEVVAIFKPGVELLSGTLLKILPDSDKQDVSQGTEGLISAGVPQKLAKKIACLDSEFACLDVVAVSNESESSLRHVSKIYFALDQRFQWSWVQVQISVLPRDDYWQSLARSALRVDLHRASRLLTADVICTEGSDITKVIGKWSDANRSQLDRYDKLLTNIQSESGTSLEQLSVLLKELNSISTVSCKVV